MPDINPDVVAVAVYLLIVMVVAVAVPIYRKRAARNKAITDDLSPGNSTPPAAAPKVTAAAIFCRKCGAALPSDSTYCHRCGTKIIRGDR